MRWLPIALLLLCGCSQPLAERLREQGYTNVVPRGGLVCPGEDDLDEGCYAERAGHGWEIAKCCHTTWTTQVYSCGKSVCSHLVPIKNCTTHERDLGPLPAEEENATPWPR
jgi:hypothetical protein